MSSSIAPPGPADFSLISALVSDNAVLKQKLDRLTGQVSTGLVAPTYAGLGAGAAVSLNLAPQITALQTWQSNIDAANGPMQVTQAAMTQLQQIAANLLSQLAKTQGTNASQVDSVAAAARQALGQVAELLNTRDGNAYVFAGQDIANPPVPSPENILTSGFVTQIAAEVAQLGIQGAAVTAANTLAIAGSNAVGTSPFSAYMSQAPASLQVPAIQVGDGQTVSVGLLASANTSVPSVGGSTSGSYMRDLLRALATVGSLTSAQVNDAGFQALMQDTNASLTGAVTAMAQDAGAFGDTQSSLTATQTTLSQTATALTGQVSAVQDVDMAAALSSLSLVQTHLQASYQLIASLSGLSLAKFISVG